MSKRLKSIEICAGAGGQALGLELAGFDHVVVVEIDTHACQTLRMNRPHWNILEFDITTAYAQEFFSQEKFRNMDLFAGGVPCPPFSMAGKQLGAGDERDLFPAALKLIEICKPKAIMLENVRGLLGSKFDSYRENLKKQIIDMGYCYPDDWKLFNASDFGVPQLRPRVILVALQEEFVDYFEWPRESSKNTSTVGEALYEEMGSEGWDGVNIWKEKACKVAPTLVGGSKKHGGPDLGPTRAKQAWAELGVDGHTIAEMPPSNGLDKMPRLTVKMAAIIQGFKPEYQWEFAGGKTAAYRQVGNAFPPPVARAVGTSIARALRKKEK